MSNLENFIGTGCKTIFIMLKFNFMFGDFKFQ